jgi:ElaB/YqjD/DUF883 family membrane-anchored ribosome-binding protein
MDASDVNNIGTDKLVADLKAVVVDAEELLKVTADQVGEGAATAKQRLSARLQAVRQQLSHAEQAAIEKARAAARNTDQYVHGHPWPAVGIGAGVGLLLGLLIGRR